MTKHKVILVVFSLLATNLFSQSVQEVDVEELANILHQYTDDSSPGLAVGVVKNGQIVYEDYLGYANLEHEIAVDQNTRFNIASNAKQYTALCILQLAEQDKLNLEDNIRKYLPTLYPDISEEITISNLITHTSGIRDYCDLYALQGTSWWKRFIDNEDALELLEKQKDLNFKPGTDYAYSNSNYILLAEIVRKVSGEKFSEVTKAMFEGLGMSNTTFSSKYSSIIPHKARPYGNWNGWREEPSITGVHGDGALYTTLQDQLRWEQNIQLNDGTTIPKRIVDASQSPISSSINPGYGYGVFFDSRKGLDYIFHDGATGAYGASFIRFPAEKVTVVVMSNNRNVSTQAFAWQISTLILGWENSVQTYPGYPDEVEKLKKLEQIVGHYKSEDGTIISIREKDGSLYREIHEREPVKLVREKGGLFEYESIPGLKMNFRNIGAPDQNFTLYMSSQPPGTYHKLSALGLEVFDRKDLNASFYNAETDTKITLKHIEGDTYSLTKNGRERQAELIIEDYLKMNSYLIHVLRDNENKVIGLSVDRDRIRNVIFERG